MSLFYPLFTWEPDFSQAVLSSIVSLQDVTSLSPAPTVVGFPQTQIDRTLAFKYQGLNRQEIAAIKEFYRDRAGRVFPFYLPSWKGDQTPLAVIGAGQNRVLVAGTTYSADHLDATKEDHYGRQLFFWMPGYTVWAERVLRTVAVDDFTEYLELVGDLPFGFDPAVGLCGWAYLARFMDENLTWSHDHPDYGSTTLGFRLIRGWNGDSQTTPTTDTDVQIQRGFHELDQAQQLTLPITNRVAYAAGPFNLHFTQDYPYQDQWACWPGIDGPRIYRTAETIFIPDSRGARSFLFPSAFLDTDHISLCFDQDAYEVIAYQKDAATIELRRFFSSSVTATTWAGLDPLVVYNGLLNTDADSATTDVVCYYRRENHNKLFMRIQRDNFATEYEICQLGAKPLELKRTWQDSDGTFHLEFLDATFRSAILTTDAYPPPPAPIVPPFVIQYPDPDSLSMGLGASALLELVIADAGSGSDAAAAGVSASVTCEDEIIRDFESDAAAAGVSASVSYDFVAPPPTEFFELTTHTVSASVAYANAIVAPPGNSDAATDTVSASLTYALAIGGDISQSDAASPSISASISYGP